MCDCHKKIGVLQIKTTKNTQNLTVMLQIKNIPKKINKLSKTSVFT